MLPLSLPQLKHTTSGNFFLMAGPCVIEGESMALSIAEKIVELTDKYEIPYIFKDRKQGHSKLTSSVALQFLSMLWELRDFSPIFQPFRSQR